MKTNFIPIILTMLLLLSCGGVGPEAPEELAIDSISVFAFPDSALVSWNTNVLSTGIIDYGPEYAVFELQAFDTAQFALSHNLVLRDLLQDTTYYFRIKAEAEDGQIKQTGIDSFFTGLNDTLEIMNLSLTPFATGAVIDWDTNLPAKGYIFYGITDTVLTDSLADTLTFKLVHSDSLKYLTVETIYYYKISAWSEGGQTAGTDTFQFTTLSPGDTTLNIYGFTLSGVTASTATAQQRDSSPTGWQNPKSIMDCPPRRWMIPCSIQASLPNINLTSRI